MSPPPIQNLKLPAGGDDGKIEAIDKLCNSVTNKMNALARLIGPDAKPSLYPDGLKAAIQRAEPLTGSMTEPPKPEIMRQ